MSVFNVFVNSSQHLLRWILFLITVACIPLPALASDADLHNEVANPLQSAEANVLEATVLETTVNTDSKAQPIQSIKYDPASAPMSSIGSVLFALAGMIVLIFILAYGAKRLQTMQPSHGQHIKTLASVSLGLKEKIALIQVGDQQLLVGITPQAINTLLVLDEPLTVKDQNSDSPNFQTLLKKALNKS